MKIPSSNIQNQNTEHTLRNCNHCSPNPTPCYTPNCIPNYTRLTLLERKKIELKLVSGLSIRTIAKHLEVSASTISREIARGKAGNLKASVNVKTKTGNHNLRILRKIARKTKGKLSNHGSYTASLAHKRSIKRSRFRKLGKRKILLHQDLKEFVQEKLRLTWSPVQIAQTLKILHPVNTTNSDRVNQINSPMHISHEAIYQYIYILPKGSLKKSLVEGLRQNRTYRRTQRKANQDEETRGKIKEMLSIHERPEEVKDRIVPGHWESDLIIGKYKRTAIATLVERTTRFTMIVPLTQGKDALSVRIALTEAVKSIPTELKKTLTHDQGKEMSQHKQFTIDTGITVYFADPSSPWQRGTNENTNGLIRQFFPKGTDFSTITVEELQRVQDLLNNRPRQTLGFVSPQKKFYDLCVALDT